jgi:hypothetical protein
VTRLRYTLVGSGVTLAAGIGSWEAQQISQRTKSPLVDDIIGQHQRAITTQKGSHSQLFAAMWLFGLVSSREISKKAVS